MCRTNNWELTFGVYSAQRLSQLAEMGKAGLVVEEMLKIVIGAHETTKARLGKAQ